MYWSSCVQSNPSAIDCKSPAPSQRSFSTFGDDRLFLWVIDHKPWAQCESDKIKTRCRKLHPSSSVKPFIALHPSIFVYHIHGAGKYEYVSNSISDLFSSVNYKRDQGGTCHEWWTNEIVFPPLMSLLFGELYSRLSPEIAAPSSEPAHVPSLPHGNSWEDAVTHSKTHVEEEEMWYITWNGDDLCHCCCWDNSTKWRRSQKSEVFKVLEFLFDSKTFSDFAEHKLHHYVQTVLVGVKNRAPSCRLIKPPHDISAANRWQTFCKQQ